ncbi:MAG: hypothetical protein ACLP3K_07100 [Candidatus Acidiferrales bacterium]
MIFAVQRCLEDYFNQCGCGDPDLYALTLAELFDERRGGKSAKQFLAAMGRIRTIFYRRNSKLRRNSFERKVLSLLDSRFKKKRPEFVSVGVAERIEASGNRLARLPRLTIRTLLQEFKNAVEANSINSFWESRPRGKLRRRAEKGMQELFGFFANVRLKGRGLALKEVEIGIGFVDFVVVFSPRSPHVVELKILKGRDLPGPRQLAVYMSQMTRTEGWLVLFDARKMANRTAIPAVIRNSAGTINVVTIDLNPIPPSKLPSS